MPRPLSAIALNGTLKSSRAAETSSTDRMLDLLAGEFGCLGVESETIRLADYDRKPAAVAVVGNEDGAHHVSAELFQALNDVGFSLAPNAVAYWVGEAMGSKDFKDLSEPPKTVTETVTMVARNTAHLARLLAKNSYPSLE